MPRATVELLAGWHGLQSRYGKLEFAFKVTTPQGEVMGVPVSWDADGAPRFGNGQVLFDVEFKSHKEAMDWISGK